MREILFGPCIKMIRSLRCEIALEMHITLNLLWVIKWEICQFHLRARLRRRLFVFRDLLFFFGTPFRLLSRKGLECSFPKKFMFNSSFLRIRKRNTLSSILHFLQMLGRIWQRKIAMWKINYGTLRRKLRTGFLNLSSGARLKQFVISPFSIFSTLVRATSSYK